MLDWGFQNTHAESLQGFIGRHRVNPVAIMDQETTRMVEDKKLAKLRNGPFCAGVIGCIEMQILRDPTSIATNT